MFQPRRYRSRTPLLQLTVLAVLIFLIVLIRRDRATVDTHLQKGTSHYKDVPQAEDYASDRHHAHSVVILHGTDQPPSAQYDMARDNRKSYARAHDYQYFFANLTGYTYTDNRATTWKKIPAIKEAFYRFPNAEWIWWLDADAIIMDGKRDLRSHLLDVLDSTLQYGARAIYSDKDLSVRPMGYYPHKQDMKSVDLVLTQDAWGVNAGSLLLRRCTWTDRLLNAWEDMFQPHMMREDQQGLINLLRQDPDLLKHIGLAPQRLINAYKTNTNDAGLYKPGDFVIHFAGCTSGQSCQQLWNEFWPKRVAA